MRALRSASILLLGALAAVGVRRDRAESASPGRTGAGSAARAEPIAPPGRGPDGERAAREGQPPLEDALLELSRGHETAAAAARLGLYGSRRAVPCLIALLRHREPQVRRAAALALGAIGDRRALPFLRRELACDDPEVAHAALRAARCIVAEAGAADG
ncbi:MAG: HEAT repeat domain-containing protein [Candidatus Brocadiia bacterium]